MATDVHKQLEKAKRYLERNKLAEAAEAYQSILNENPAHPDALQGLGDIYTHLGQHGRATGYYGVLFDRFCDARDENKALALYTRALKGTQQPPERMARYALLLQKQGRNAEAVEHYFAASELLLARGKQEPALDCLERIAQLEPEDPARHFAAGNLAEQIGKTSLAVRYFLRAAQLSEAAGDATAALGLLERAHLLAPAERSPALLYAQALLRHGGAAKALALLEPYEATDSDTAFLNTLNDALLAAGHLDRACAVLHKLLPHDPAALSKLFDLARAHLERQDDPGAIAVLTGLQEWSLKARKENDFATRLELFAESFPRSRALAEFCAAANAALNREASYFEALVRLFEIYLQGGEVPKAAEALDKLAEIDPYDYGNQARLARIEASADPAVVARIRARIGQAATHAAKSSASSPAAKPAGAAKTESASASDRQADGRAEHQSFEDLIVQAEIFLQYSLRAQALEKLKKIAENFPQETASSPRLRELFKQANWWPAGVQPDPPASKGAGESRAAPDPSETLRDLAKISEISQALHRQVSPRAMLAAAIQEVGQYLRATRCFAVVGAAGRLPQLASEYCAPGVEPAPGAALVRLLAQLDRTSPDGLGGLPLQRDSSPVLAELGLDSLLGVPLSDPESKAAAGMIAAGYAGAHGWRPHEKYFLQTVGEQMLLAINHARLRAVARTLGAADEKTGLLARSSYLDCLLQETQRAKSSPGSRLSLILVQVDQGRQLLLEHGESAMENYIEQVARELQQITRQTDLAVKYSSWALGLILPDTPLDSAQAQAAKIRQAGAAARIPWGGPAPALSASVCEALLEPEYDAEDIVTELINRAEAGLEEARRRGGNAVVSPGAH